MLILTGARETRARRRAAGILLESLPQGQFTFDVVSHGIGGLVLRHIVERGRQYGTPARRFVPGRAVLVAAPNGGTPLASAQRWDNTLGWIANLLELFPDMRGRVAAYPS